MERLKAAVIHKSECFDLSLSNHLSDIRLLISSNDDGDLYLFIGMTNIPLNESFISLNKASIIIPPDIEAFFKSYDCNEYIVIKKPVKLSSNLLLDKICMNNLINLGLFKLVDYLIILSDDKSISLFTESTESY
jgi:hypothetical protein